MSKKKVFMFGIAIGFVSVVIFVVRVEDVFNDEGKQVQDRRNHWHVYNEWLLVEKLERRSKKSADNIIPESQFLYDKVNIICVILTKNVRQARGIVGTWSRHCNSVDFVGNIDDKFVPVTLKTSLKDTRFTCVLSRYLAVSRLSLIKDLDKSWIFIADDQTFALIENLRYYLAPLNSSHAYYIGHPLKITLSSEKLNILKAGIVLSTQTLAQIAFSFESGCPTSTNGKSFDTTLAKKMRELLIGVKDTRDEEQRSRFMGRPLEMLMLGNKISPYDEYFRKSIFPSRVGVHCCSDSAVTLHGVDAADMYFFEFLIFGLSKAAPNSLNVPLRSNFSPPLTDNSDTDLNLPEQPKVI